MAKFICVPSFFPEWARPRVLFVLADLSVLRPRGGPTRRGPFFLSRKMVFWRFGRFRNTRNVEYFSLDFVLSRVKLRSVTLFSGKTAKFICIPLFFYRNTRFLWRKIYPSPLSLSAYPRFSREIWGSLSAYPCFSREIWPSLSAYPRFSGEIGPSQAG